MPCAQPPAELPLTADVLREHDPDPRRLLFWLKGPREGRFQHWQRIAADPRAELAAGEGISAAPARVTAFRQELAGKVRRLLRSWNREPLGGTRFILPTGEWVEPVAPPREDALLAWADEPGGALDPAHIARRWPDGEAYTQLGPHLFLVLGVRLPDTGPPPADERGAPIPLPVVYTRWLHAPPAAPAEPAPPPRPASPSPSPQDLFARLSREVRQLARRGLWEQALERATNLLHRTQQQAGPGHPLAATALNHLGWLYQSRGDGDAAERLYRQALAIRCPEQGDAHPNVATSLNNLALLYQARGDCAEAEALHRQALESRRAVLGQGHPLVATSLNNLASMYFARGDPAAAESLLRLALEAFRRTLGAEHPEVATCLDNLAKACHALGDRAAAAEWAGQADQVRRAGAGKDYPRIADTLNLVAEVAEPVPPPTPAAPADSEGPAAEATGLGEGPGEDDVAEHADPPSREADGADRDEDRTGGVQGESPLAQTDAAPETMPPAEPSAAALVVADVSSPAGGPPQVVVSPQVWTEASRGDGFVAGPAACLAGAVDWTAAPEEASPEPDGPDRPAADPEDRPPESDHRALADRLPAGSALVEFERVSGGDAQTTPARYRAFVLPAAEPADVRTIDLGEAEPIDRMVAEFRARIAREGGGPRSPLPTETPAASEALAGGTRLRQAVFDPLTAALDGRTRLFLAPAGSLACLPFEVLPAGPGRHLIDTYQISYLAAARDVLRFGAAAHGPPQPPVVAADPDFDLASLWASRARGPGRFPRLGASRRGAKRLAGLLGVEPWLAGAVRKGRLKELRSPRILHLATHCFFERDETPEGVGAPENPLTGSGLALAGANLPGPDGSRPGEGEGTLTAEEVAGLNLLDTELVVLPACDTGPGGARVGERVLALREGFTRAGAARLVLSLWKVTDWHTNELLGDFYRRVLDGEPPGEALRQAQLALRATQPDPFYWGAFTCQGDVAPLAQDRGAQYAAAWRRALGSPAAWIMPDLGSMRKSVGAQRGGRRTVTLWPRAFSSLMAASPIPGLTSRLPSTGGVWRNEPR
jgi:CHAT domain-containing protein/tetratricopeptide (TPR) repeat protein